MRNSKQADHSGSSFDEFLRDEGILEETEAVAIKRVIAWQLRQAMRQKRLTKKEMAGELGTSRSQLDRLLDPKHAGVTLSTLARAARILGKRLKVQVIDPPGPGHVARKRPAAARIGNPVHKIAAAK